MVQAAPPRAIALSNVSKAFRVGERVVRALEDVSLGAGAEEFVSLIGPSGCGKSTLLNLVAGLLEPDSGEITLHGEPGLPRLGRSSYMPQRDLLLPWRSVLDNILLAPEIQGRDRAQARRETFELLPLFGLEGRNGH